MSFRNFFFVFSFIYGEVLFLFVGFCVLHFSELLSIYISHVLFMRMHASQLLGVHTHTQRAREKEGGGAGRERGSARARSEG